MSQENNEEVSKEAKEKAEHLKRNIEKIMGGRLKSNRLRKKRDVELEQKLNDPELNAEKKSAIQIEYFLDESHSLREQRKAQTKLKSSDFEILKVIGKGAFGEVRIVRDKHGDKKIYAMKTMLKKMMISKNQLGHIVAERDLMAEADNPWLVKLFFAFQDQTYLYLVMEYCGGGDLMGLLIKKDILDEDTTRFYMAELASAINYVHHLGYVHRDLKPDNVLIANDGHIRLSDFGLAKSFQSSNDQQLGNWQQYVATLKPEDVEKLKDDDKAQENDDDDKKDKKKVDRKQLYSTVGTPDYIAIEVLYQKGYDKTVDWWSMGVIMFECLCGYAPFHANEPLATCRKIVRYEKYFKVPHDIKLSKNAMDIMKKLVCPVDKRIGWEDIKQHAWMKKIPWNNLQSMKAPFVPQLQSEFDAKYFDSVESEQTVDGASKAENYSNEGNRVWGYTFTRQDAEKAKQLKQQLNNDNSNDNNNKDNNNKDNNNKDNKDNNKDKKNNNKDKKNKDKNNNNNEDND